MKNKMLKIGVATLFVVFGAFGALSASSTDTAKPAMKCQAGKCGGASKCGGGKAMDTNATKKGHEKTGKCGGAKCGGSK
jgi:hypothetical protein